MQKLRTVHNAEKRAALGEAVEVVEAVGGPVRLLDIGCGPGSDVHKWADLGIGHALGLDNDPTVIAEARARSGRYGARRDFRFEVCADVVTRLAGMPAGCVDLATCHFSAHFFAGRLGELCRELRRVVRAGGRWVVATIDAGAVPEHFRGQHLRVTKSECGARMRYRLEGTRYFGGGDTAEEPTLATADLVREAAGAGWVPVRCVTFGERGLPSGYTAELGMITGFHEWLHFA